MLALQRGARREGRAERGPERLARPFRHAAPEALARGKHPRKGSEGRAVRGEPVTGRARWRNRRRTPGSVMPGEGGEAHPSVRGAGRDEEGGHRGAELRPMPRPHGGLEPRPPPARARLPPPLLQSVHPGSAHPRVWGPHLRDPARITRRALSLASSHPIRPRQGAPRRPGPLPAPRLDRYSTASNALGQFTIGCSPVVTLLSCQT